MGEHPYGRPGPGAPGTFGTSVEPARDERALDERALDERTLDGAPGRHAPRPAVAEHLAAELAPILSRHGVHAALALLNARTRYRFTGLYRVEPPRLRNLHLYDRENPSLDLAGDISMLEDTYCVFPVATGEPFATAYAPGDARLATHVKRGTVLSYLGVPIRGADGRVRGTLCHFDCRPRLMPHGETELLARVATIFASEGLDAPPGGGAPSA